MPNQPIKQAAHYAAQRAFPNRQPCERCGRPDGERHHPDYGAPTDILWLCPSCHGIEHKGAPNRDELVSSALFLMGEGVPQIEISAILGVSRSTMYGWFRRRRAVGLS